MHVEYDATKNETNIRERKLPFSLAAKFDFQTATFKQDNRRDYGEIRIRALGYLDGRLHTLVFTETAMGIRVISFRKANNREVRTYGQETKP